MSVKDEKIIYNTIDDRGFNILDISNDDDIKLEKYMLLYTILVLVRQ